MRKTYVKPMMQSEAFVANEYVAACWKINCNVPNGYGYLDNDNSGSYTSGDTLLTPTEKNGQPSTVYGCGVWHTGVEGVPDDGPVANAMWHPVSGGDGGHGGKGPGGNNGSSGTTADYAVYYWKDGDGAYDVHFSKVSDAQWQTNPNAS